MSTTPSTAADPPRLSAALRELLHHAKHGTLLYHAASGSGGFYDYPRWVRPHRQPARTAVDVTRSGNRLQELGLIVPGPAAPNRLAVLTDAGRRALAAHPLPHAWDDPRGKERRTCTRCHLHVAYTREPTSKGGGEFNFTNASYAWAWRDGDRFRYAHGLRNLPSCIPPGVRASRDETAPGAGPAPTTRPEQH